MKKLILAIATALLALCLQAKVKPNNLVSDHMVLQQGTSVRLWGTGPAGRNLTVKVSWGDAITRTRIGSDGRWEVMVDTPAASFDTQSIVFDDGDVVKVEDVLIGEVWIAGGQSNMDMPVRGFDGCPTDDLLATILEARDEWAIRSYKMDTEAKSLVPEEDSDRSWKVCSSETVSSFGAVAYYYASMVSKVLGCPVGMIEANKGGTRVESWLSKEAVAALGSEPMDYEAMKQKTNQEWLWPYVWGNAIFHPLVKYTVKGILFYQGCSNVGDPGDQYSERMALLAKDWRRQIGLGDIPFYYVQICPYAQGGGRNTDGIEVALLQEQQFKALEKIPNSGLVCTNDCVYPYEKDQVHPAQKRKVGQRLASLALNKTYGMSWFPADSPSYKSMEVRGNEIALRFDHMDWGMNRGMDIEGFEIADESRVFHPAQVRRRGRDLLVSSPEVEKPVAVRYCFHNWQIGNLGNAKGLPLFPFRTDEW